MGTIQKRPNGSYTARIRRHGQPTQSRTFPTKKDARRWVADTESAISRECFMDTKAARQTLLSDVLARYAEEVSPMHRGSAEEVIRLNAMRRDPLAGYSLATVKTPIVAEYCRRRLLKVSGSTVNRELNLLHTVFEVARKDWGIAMPSNPVADVRRPRSNPPRERRLTIAEQSLLLHACKQARSWWLAPIVELAIHTGMRQSEVRALQWQNVNTEECVVTLPAAATKTLTTRTVPLNKRCMTVIQSIRGTRVGPLQGPVFPDVTRNALKLAFKRARIRSGLEDLHFHDTRHEATSRLFELGLSDSEVALVTGHKTRAMLARYTHLRAKDLVHRLDAQPPKSNDPAVQKILDELRRLMSGQPAPSADD
ncbi:site-specific integrase [Paraburkholderia sp. C35]|uniref:tyrosine-type recombinase/integrase n=1 Tax=Paraburkholderia sp. C35 TaxID=2126993 RepID=UPI000D694E76|nr:site-specific integrase [Paraburkholderia sp. C35]